MLLLILLEQAYSWDAELFQKNIIVPVRQIIELPGDFKLNETTSEPPDETGTVLHTVTGKFNETIVFIQFYESADGRLDLSWVEGINHEDWRYMPPSRQERLFALGLLADELAPAVPEPIRVLTHRGARRPEGVILQMALLNEIGGKNLIHRVDYKHDTRDSVKLIGIVDVNY